MKNIYFIVLFISISLGCKKAEERTCWKSSGEVIQETFDLTHLNFKGLSFFDDIDVNLIKDSINYLSVTSYKNQLNHISYEVVDSLLEIKDNNKCKFLRNNDHETTIDVHYNDLTVLSLNGNGKISNTTPLSNEIIHIYSHSSNGEIDLNLNASSLVLKFVNGTLSGKIKGAINNANIFHFGYSNVNFEQLQVENLRITNKSDANIFVNASNSLTAELLSLGNIYYKGNPSIQILENTMGSQLINNN